MKFGKFSVKTIALAALLALLASGCAVSSATAAPQHPDQRHDQREIGMEQAKRIAVRDSGARDVRFGKTKTDWEHGRLVYEIEFYSNDREYEYEIDAYNGKILKRKVENHGYRGGNEHPHGNSKHIGAERARNIALRHAGVPARDVRFLKAELDYSRHGRDEYDIEFMYNGRKYEYEIDAFSGKVLEFESKERRY